MANLNMPKGLSPVGTVTGSDYNQQGRLYAISTADTTNSYAIGDIVSSNIAGGDTNGVPYVTKYAVGSSVPLGIIVGIRVADPGVSLQAANLDLTQTYITAGTRTAVRYVYVVDDPNVIFEVQADGTGISQANIHSNASLTIQTNSSPTGSSPFSTTVATAASTTNTLPIRLLGLSQRVVAGGGTVGAYALVVAKFNIHEFGVSTGTGYTAT